MKQSKGHNGDLKPEHKKTTEKETQPGLCNLAQYLMNLYRTVLTWETSWNSLCTVFILISKSVYNYYKIINLTTRVAKVYKIISNCQEHITSPWNFEWNKKNTFNQDGGHMGRNIGTPAFGHVRPQNFRSACAFAQSDQFLHRAYVWNDANPAGTWR